MRLNENSRLYLRSLGFDDSVLLFLVACKLELQCTIDDKEFGRLIQKEIIARDYISDNKTIKVLIPLFEGEDGDKMLDISNISFDIETYRKLFKGIRLGSMGNKESCHSNMVRWLVNNPEYTFDDVLSAANYYIQNTDRQYISKADNFIYADDVKGKEFSRLSMVIEDMGETNEQYKLV